MTLSGKIVGVTHREMHLKSFYFLRLTTVFFYFFILHKFEELKRGRGCIFIPFHERNNFKKRHKSWCATFFKFVLLMKFKNLPCFKIKKAAATKNLLRFKIKKSPKS